jgi:hypothetical protein
MLTDTANGAHDGTVDLVEGRDEGEDLMRAMMFLLVLAGLVFVSAPSASACDAAGPNAHVGAVTAIDPTRKTFTLKDAETTRPIVFVTTTEQLKGVKVEDEVAVTYVAEGKQLRATAIKRN